jgi:hypothetical protein
VTAALRAVRRARRWLRRRRVGSRAVAVVLVVLLAPGGSAAQPVAAEAASPTPFRDIRDSGSRWTAMWTDYDPSRPLSHQGVLDVVSDHDVTGTVSAELDGERRDLVFVHGAARLTLPAAVPHRLVPPSGVRLTIINAAPLPGSSNPSPTLAPPFGPPPAPSPSPLSPSGLPSPPSGTPRPTASPSTPNPSPSMPLSSPQASSTPATPSSAPGLPHPPPSGQPLPPPAASPGLAPTPTAIVSAPPPGPFASPPIQPASPPVSPSPAPPLSPLPGQAQPPGASSKAVTADKQREEEWGFESLVKAAKGIHHNADAAHFGLEVSVLVGTGTSCALHVGSSDLLKCVKTTLAEEAEKEKEKGTAAKEAGRAGETAQAAAAALRQHDAAAEEAAQAASESRAKLAMETRRFRVVRIADGESMALAAPDDIVVHGLLYDRLTAIYQTSSVCVSIMVCRQIEYIVRADGQVEVYAKGELLAEREVLAEPDVPPVNSQPLGAPQGDNELAAAEGLGKAPGEEDTSLEAARGIRFRSLRFFAAADRVLRVGGYVLGIAAIALDGIEAFQALQAGDRRAAFGDFAAGLAMLVILLLTAPVLGLATGGLGFVVLFLVWAGVTWAGPPLVKWLAEWLYGKAVGDDSNIESPFADLFAPDIYVTNTTGRAEVVRLQLDTVGAFDINPPWDSGTWNVIADPDGWLEADGARWSHLHYQLKTVAGWQRETGWRISRQDFAAWARRTLPLYGFSPAAVEGFVQAWSGLEQGDGDLDVFPQSRATVDRLGPLTIQPSTVSSRRVWFLFAPAEGESAPRPLEPHAEPSAAIDVQEWGVVFDPGAYLAGSPP